MKRKTSLKEILTIIGLLALAVPSSLTVVACGNKQSNSQQPHSNSEKVVQKVNSIIYKLDVMVGDKVEELMNIVTYDFIKDQLDENIKEMFEEEDFTINKITNNKGEKLLDDDFAKIGIVNAKINYDYAEHENQTTNLEINVQTKKILLAKTFKDFEFVDQKNVEKFLDANDIDVITEQVLAKLNISSLEKASLVLENQTSNSIILKAKEDSKYAGEITLTWNLKLFEVYGAKIRNPISKNEWVKQGLKGYFYLESGSNKIKYFDCVWYFKFRDRNEFDPTDNSKYHHFHFVNQNDEKKDFTIHGDIWTDQIDQLFRDFNFTTEVKVKVDGPKFNKIKVFDVTNNRGWEGLIKKTEFRIDSLGKVSQIN
ncbi:MAG: hypothetical protein ACRC8P_00985 [Spiroplasma sp.]